MTEVLARGDRGSSHRLSDELADRLLDVIREQGLQPGDRLPSERELGEQFGVSRTVVREAVRNLAGRNVVRTRRGASPTVAAFPASAVTQLDEPLPARAEPRCLLREGARSPGGDRDRDGRARSPSRDATSASPTCASSTRRSGHSSLRARASPPRISSSIASSHASQTIRSSSSSWIRSSISCSTSARRP